MSNYSSEPSCPFCGTRLTGQESDFIRSGASVRCRECGTILTRDTFEPSGADLTEQPFSPQVTTTPRHQQPPRNRTGTLVFFIGFIVFSLGLYSWIFYIPIFDLTYYGEILGAIAVVKGLSDLKKEASDPSAIRFMVAGVLLWIGAWLSWIFYIPVLSNAFIGEFGGLGLIIFGYLKSL